MIARKRRDCVKSRTVHHRESEVSSEAEKSTFSKMSLRIAEMTVDKE